MTRKSTPSSTVLLATPQRALGFLLGVSRNPGIQHLLATRGFGAEDYERGWALLRGVAGYTPGAGLPAEVATEATVAMAALEAWDEPTFRIARSTLVHFHPEQHDFVFAGGLEATRGPRAILVVKLFLDRVDALDGGKGRRKASRKADAAAVAALAKKGIDRAERERVRGLLEQATQAEGLAPASGDRGLPRLPARKSNDEHEAALRDLFYWLNEWSEAARVVIQRRDFLIRLGLASPRRGKEASNEPAKGEEAATAGK